MKGLKIFKATASNTVDIFPLLKEALKENVLQPTATEKQLKAFWYPGLVNELTSPFHLWLLAKRARGFYGVLHAIVVPSRWDGSIQTMFIDLVFVTENKRKQGIGQKLIDEVRKSAEDMGIGKIEFLVPDSQIELAKKHNAEKLYSFMRINL